MYIQPHFVSQYMPSVGDKLQRGTWTRVYPHCESLSIAIRHRAQKTSWPLLRRFLLSRLWRLLHISLYAVVLGQISTLERPVGGPSHDWHWKFPLQQHQRLRLCQVVDWTSETSFASKYSTSTAVMSVLIKNMRHCMGHCMSGRCFKSM